MALVIGTCVAARDAIAQRAATSSDVVRLNKQQTYGTLRFLFSREDDFNLARQEIKAHPYLADPARWLIAPPPAIPKRL